MEIDTQLESPPRGLNQPLVKEQAGSQFENSDSADSHEAKHMYESDSLNEVSTKAPKEAKAVQRPRNKTLTLKAKSVTIQKEAK